MHELHALDERMRTDGEKAMSSHDYKFKGIARLFLDNTSK